MNPIDLARRPISIDDFPPSFGDSRGLTADLVSTERVIRRIVSTMLVAAVVTWAADTLTTTPGQPSELQLVQTTVSARVGSLWSAATTPDIGR